MVMSRVIGIDLGTTNSCVAVLEGDVPTVIANKERIPDNTVCCGFCKRQDDACGRSGKKAGGCPMQSGQFFH